MERFHLFVSGLLIGLGAGLFIGVIGIPMWLGV
jgi:hypothetical protein